MVTKTEFVITVSKVLVGAVMGAMTAWLLLPKEVVREEGRIVVTETRYVFLTATTQTESQTTTKSVTKNRRGVTVKTTTTMERTESKEEALTTEGRKYVSMAMGSNSVVNNWGVGVSYHLTDLSGTPRDLGITASYRLVGSLWTELGAYPFLEKGPALTIGVKYLW